MYTLYNKVNMLKVLINIDFFLYRKFTSLSVEDHRVLFVGLEPIISLSAMIGSKVSFHFDKNLHKGNYS